MFCSNCGTKNEGESKFCSTCGKPINNSFTSNNTPNQVNINNNSKNDNKLKLIIIIMVMIILILILGCVALFGFGINGKINSRTIMMYISGNDLESNGEIVSVDLAAIDSSKINLSNTNVVIYTGGTKKWHNFVNSDENAIYMLKENGFEKVKSYPKNNMGDYKQFTNFLDYVYTNYKTDKYDLILYDHGGAIDGAIYDEDTSDNLSLQELKLSFSSSKFNSNNKLETVLFRTCLNGTLEVASVLSPYADYMIASEETTYGSSRSNVLSFLNNVTIEDNAVEYGKKFITRYEEQMNEIDPYETVTRTYSIIDLSKIDKVNRSLNEFSKELDVKNNYALIARTRTNLFQYASSATNIYDMVDLYSLSNKLSVLSNSKAKKLQDNIKDAVVYNWSNNDESKGLSIYFPFKGSAAYKSRFLSIYKQLGYNNDYYNFISTINNIQNSTTQYAYSFNLSDNKTEIKSTKNKKEFRLKLTDEQANNFARGAYIILKKEENDYYTPIYGGTDAKLEDGNFLTSNITDNLISIYDPKDQSNSLVLAFQDRHKKGQYTIPVIMQNYGSDFSDFKTKSTNLIVQEDKNKNFKLTQIVPTNKNDEDLVQGTLLKLEDFKSIQFTKFQYKVLDSNGNYTVDWEGNDTFYLWEISDKNGLKENSFEIRKQSLDDDGEYYCVFMITDIKNNTVYSNLIKIDN